MEINYYPSLQEIYTYMEENNHIIREVGIDKADILAEQRLRQRNIKKAMEDLELSEKYDSISTTDLLSVMKVMMQYMEDYT